MTETMACRTLLWIVLKILDCIASDDQTPDGEQASRLSNEPSIPPSSPSGTHVDWGKVDGYLSDWYSRVPDNFEPCFRIPQQETYLQNTNPSGLAMQGLFIANPMGSASISLYHFSRILILLHGPFADQNIAISTGPGRLQANRQFSQLVTHHASEIYAAALGKPHAAVQMHMVLPMSLASLCLDSPGQKTVLEKLLLELQDETGILTAWAIEKFKDPQSKTDTQYETPIMQPAKAYIHQSFDRNSSCQHQVGGTGQCLNMVSTAVDHSISKSMAN